MGANGETPQRVKADPAITAYQPAARIYCKKTGENPDEMMPVPHAQLAGVVTHMPYWYTVAERMYDLALMLRSMSEHQAQLVAANDSKLVKP